MRISLHGVIAMACALFFAACSTPSRPSVDVNIRNDSTNDLDWVGVHWDEGELRAGVLPAGVWSLTLDAGLPKHSQSDTAFVEFADDKDGWTYQPSRPTSERKRYRIPVDVSPLRQLPAGHHRVTFSILSFTEAKLEIDK